jgi:hypothetical protein
MFGGRSRILVERRSFRLDFLPIGALSFKIAIEAEHRSRSAPSVSSCDRSFTPIAIGAFGFKLD